MLRTEEAVRILKCLSLNTLYLKKIFGIDPQSMAQLVPVQKRTMWFRVQIDFLVERVPKQTTARIKKMLEGVLGQTDNRRFRCSTI